jgi:hypothetical protein
MPDKLAGLIPTHRQDLDAERRAPRRDVGAFVVILEREIVQHPLPGLWGDDETMLPSDARLFAGDGFLDLPRHGKEPPRLGKVRVVGWQGQIDKFA